MTTAATSLLGLALPVTGELSGVWGQTVNDSITTLLDSAVAGTTTLSTDADVTLTTTTLASNQARQAILLCSGSRTGIKTITAPAQSKIYTIINATTGGYSVKLVGVGPTTGLTIPNGASAVVAWNGSDFIEIGSSTIGNLVVNGNLTVTGSTTLSGGTANGVAYLNGSKVVTTGSALTFDGTNVSTALGGSYYSANSNYGLGTPDSAGLQIFTASGDSIRLGTRSSGTFTELARLTSTGLGIGTSTITSGAGWTPKLVLSGTSAAAIVKGINSQEVSIGSSNGMYIDCLGNTTGSNNNIIFRNASGNSSFSAVEVMRLDSSGNLGIGTTSPVSRIDARSASAVIGNYQQIQAFSTDTAAINLGGGIALGGNYSGSSTIAVFGNIVGRKENSTDGNYAGYLAFGTNAQATGVVERARIDSSGNFGIGTSSPAYKLDVYQSTGGASNYIRVGAGSYGYALIGVDGTGMRIQSDSASNPMYFITNGSERARIDSSGRLLIGMTTAIGIENVQSTGAISGGNQYSYFAQGATASYTCYALRTYSSSAAAVVGSITYTGTATAYNTSSDYRLKDNQQPLTGSGEFIDALQPKTWNWKADGSKGIGFIAHEVQAVSPGSVVGEKDAVDEEGNPKYQAMEYGSAEFIANIIAELQSLRQRLAVLEAK